ncbi:hypothetical protein TWF718_000235 [Orbilia javanica]|uniref:RNA polymerase-associated protein LEO1 n=1 Tax=Orbilia javanica TaxID=47235 RepID=A0AAN8NAY6_9PEZI
MSSPLSDISDPPPRRRQVASDDDDDDDVRSISPAPKASEDNADNIFDDDEDEPVPKPRSRRQASPKASDDDDNASDLDADLFGDGSDLDMDDAGPSKKERTLDDSELDSGDDSGNESRRRRRDDYGFVEEERDETSYEVDIGLHKLPQSANDEVYILKIPQFISLAPQVFKPETFQAPKLPPGAAITPYTFATTAIRWRHSPFDSSKLESNSRIIQWSDGTFSLQIGSSKEGLYDLPTTPLIPPPDKEYNPTHDSFTFLAEPLANSRLVRFFAHATQTMGVTSASNNLITDDIKQMVAARYQASQKRRTDDGMKQVELSYKIEDPEKARRDAEALEREVERNRKRMEARKIKEAEAGVGGPRKVRRGPGGMGMDDLEEDEEGGGSYSKKKSGGYSKRDKDDYYDDDDDDGFIERDPDSDEEEEEVSESEEEEEYRSSRKKDKKKGKKKKEKRRQRDEDEDEDEEPEAEFTDEEDEEPQRAKSPGKPNARSASEVGDDEDEDGELSRAPDRKKRKVIIDDSDDDE